MTIKKFKYNGKQREVLVTKNNGTWFEGYDLGKLTEEEAKEAWRVKVRDVDIDTLSEDERKKVFENLKELSSSFRRFSNNKIQ